MISLQGHIQRRCYQNTLKQSGGQSEPARWLDFGSRCRADVRNIKTSAVVVLGEIVAKFVLRLMRLARSDCSWTIGSLHLADTTDNNL